jgi:hypothetical protein
MEELYNIFNSLKSDPCIKTAMNFKNEFHIFNKFKYDFHIFNSFEYLLIIYIDINLIILL